MRSLGLPLFAALALGCGGSNNHPAGGNPDGGSSGADLAAPPAIDLALDDSATGPSPDLRSPPDLTPVTPFGCASALGCVANCLGDQACASMCLAEINTPMGQGYLNAFVGCVQTACPTTNMGPCDMRRLDYQSACMQCAQQAIAMGGACHQANNNCMNDG